jgi:phosphate transport system substrate-binding protein
MKNGMRSGKLSLFVVLLLACVAPLLIPSAASSLTYDGSSTVGEGVMRVAARKFQAATGIRFKQISMAGSGAGYRAAMQGTVDIGGLSRSLSESELGQSPHSTVIGHDAIAVFVNGLNPVKSLTQAQVKGIFTGKITNWKEVGGEDARIAVVTEIKRSDRATIKVFKSLALDGEDFGPSKELDKPHACVLFVRYNRNAITHASLSFTEENTRAVMIEDVPPNRKTIGDGTYPFTRPLLLVTREEPAGEVKDFIDFLLSPDGQDIVRQKFIPVN